MISGGNLNCQSLSTKKIKLAVLTEPEKNSKMTIPANYTTKTIPVIHIISAESMDIVNGFEFWVCKSNEARGFIEFMESSIKMYGLTEAVKSNKSSAAIYIQRIKKWMRISKSNIVHRESTPAQSNVQ